MRFRVDAEIPRRLPGRAPRTLIRDWLSVDAQSHNPKMLGSTICLDSRSFG